MTETQRAAFKKVCADMGAIMTLLGFEEHPGIDAILRAITELMVKAADNQAAQAADAGREAVALEATPMKPAQFGGTETAWRMDAYYYSFGPTGIAIIDRILSAVACAGKSFHHTDCWDEECSPYEHLRGDTVTTWIQNAADDAADVLRGKNVAAINAELVEALEAALRFLDDPAGCTSEIAMDRAKFKAFMERVEADQREAVSKARAALSRAKEQKS